MKRSEIDKQIAWAIGACEKLHCALPGFAYWSPKQWEENKAFTEHLRKVGMGWDVTDYNSNEFDKVGAVLFTLRNGEVAHPESGQVYCEKYIAMKAGQMLPCHFHYFKTEDIINRAGGTLRVYVWNSTPGFDGYQKDLKGDVHLLCDGQPVTVKNYTYNVTIKVRPITGSPLTLDAISEAIGRLTVLTDQGRALQLRRINRVRTIHGSLAIEGNTLSEAQITALFDGKPVMAQGLVEYSLPDKPNSRLQKYRLTEQGRALL